MNDQPIPSALLSCIEGVLSTVSKKAIWQSRLLSIRDFERATHEYSLPRMPAANILALVQCGFLQADEIRADCELDPTRFTRVSVYQAGEVFQDKGVAPSVGALVDCLERGASFDLKAASAWLHPFRMYEVCHALRYFDMKITPLSLLRTKDSMGRLLSRLHDLVRKELDSVGLERWKYWKGLTSLCVALDVVFHERIYSHISFGAGRDVKGVRREIRSLKSKLVRVVKALGVDWLTRARQGIEFQARIANPNADLALLVRIMSPRERGQIKGGVGLAELFYSMSETLRRAMECTWETRFEEEGEVGLGHAEGNLRQIFHGSERLIDAGRGVRQQFVRRLGLDFGLRVRVYVEGATEKAALERHLSWNESIQIVDLGGQFVEGKGKGLAFKDSLLADMRSKILSLIMLDGDREDNIRVVKAAARREEMFGFFFICKPDFELENFTVEELSCVIMSQWGSGRSIDLGRKLTGSVSGEELVRRASQALDVKIIKGPEWGALLGEFSMKNMPEAPNEGKARVLNKLVWVAIQSASIPYEPSFQQSRTCPESGWLVDR